MMANTRDTLIVCTGIAVAALNVLGVFGVGVAVASGAPALVLLAILPMIHSVVRIAEWVVES